jgi:hypothetical protein
MCVMLSQKGLNPDTPTLSNQLPERKIRNCTIGQGTMRAEVSSENYFMVSTEIHPNRNYSKESFFRTKT